jgi:O-antigen/teichoic acid export membrane protein
MFKNVAQLASSSITSNLIPLAGLPILARIYDIESFAKLAVFLATISIVSVFVAMRYESAIPTVKNIKRVNELVALGHTLTFATAAFVALAIFAIQYVTKLYAIEYNYIKEEQISLIIMATIGVGINQTLNAAILRYQKYKKLAISKIIQATAITSLQISIAGTVNDGLIIGWLCGIWVTNLYLYANLNVKDQSNNRLKIKHIIAAARYYKNFPKFSLLGTFCDTLAQQLPLYFIMHQYGGGPAAIYGMGVKLLGYPLSMISSSIGQVLITEIASNSHRTKNQTLKTILIILRFLIVIAGVILLSVYLVSDFAIELYLGEKWESLKEFIMILAMINLIRFMVNPLSSALGMKQHLSTVLCWQITYVLSMILLSTLCSGSGFNIYLNFLAIHEIILYGIYLVLIIQKWRP